MELKHGNLYRVKTAFTPALDSRGTLIAEGTILRYDFYSSLSPNKMFWSSEIENGWQISRLLTQLELINLEEISD